MFDSGDAIQHWINHCETVGLESEISSQILENIVTLSDETWLGLLHGIKTGCRSARHALLQSLCGLAALKNRFPAQWIEPAIEALRSLDKNDLATLLVLPTTSTCGLDGLGRGNLKEGFSPPHSARVVAEVAIAIAQASSTQQKSLATAADTKLMETATTFADILEEQDISKVLAWLASIGFNFFTWLDGSDPEAEQAAGFLNEHPEGFAVLVQWLTESLNTSDLESPWFPKTETLMRVCAEATVRMPSAFVKLADARRLEPLLVRAVERQAKYGRRAAIVLLSHLRKATPRVVKAFLFALRDDRVVQEAAIQSAERYQELRKDALAPLLQALYDDSAVVAYGVSRMLSAIGRQERTQSSHRNDILAGLATAIRDRSSQRGVYRYVGTGSDDGENAVRIVRFDQLDKAFHRAILEITGILGQ